MFEEAESRAPRAPGSTSAVTLLTALFARRFAIAVARGSRGFAHAAVMFVAWGIMIPVGVACSALRDAWTLLEKASGSSGTEGACSRLD